MNLMQNWTYKKPTWAPADEGAPAPDEAPAVEDAAPPADAPAAAEQPVDEPAAPDYSFLPEQYRGDDGPDLDGFKAHYDELAAAQAIRDEAMADVPEDAAGYEFAVPEDLDFGDLELPEDFSVDLKTDDPALAPLFQELGGVLHKHNLPKGATGDIMSVLAKYEATRYSGHYAAAKAEMQALGSSAQSRIANIERALQAKLPADQMEAIKAATSTAAGVKALESLIKPRGLSAPTPQPNGVDLDHMTPYEKLKLANSTAKM